MRVFLGEAGFQFTSKKKQCSKYIHLEVLARLPSTQCPWAPGNVSPQTSSTGGNAVTGAGLGEGGSEGAEGTPPACQVKGLKGPAPPGMIKTL